MQKKSLSRLGEFGGSGGGFGFGLLGFFFSETGKFL